MPKNKSFNTLSYIAIPLPFCAWSSTRIVLRSLNIPLYIYIGLYSQHSLNGFREKFYGCVRNYFTVVTILLCLWIKMLQSDLTWEGKKTLAWLDFHTVEDRLWRSYVEISESIRMSPPRLCEDKYLTKCHFNGRCGLSVILLVFGDHQPRI